MRKKIASVFVCLVLAIVASSSLQAGGRLETIDLTGAPVLPNGLLVAKVIGIQWDVRTIPVRYSMNTTLDPVPNPLGAPFLTVAQAATAFQASLDEWNKIPTSYILMSVTGAPTANPGLRGFDFINELTFRTAGGFNAIASSPSVTFIEDVTLVDGDMIDNDTDPDVSSAITVATDVDGDGDIEFPAGFYKAGTILDNDVQFNTKVSNGFRYTIDPAQVDTITRSVDLKAVAVHEFGHSFGLSHSNLNQTSTADGTGATMFPFIDTGDPAQELAQATPHPDDIAWASYLYPEGTASSGLPALQAGDIAFRKRYGVITGNVRHGVMNQDIAGAAVQAEDVTGAIAVGAYSGTTRLSFNPNNGELDFLATVAESIVNGNYSIPVPMSTVMIGKFLVTLPFALYELAIEAVDGTPTSAGSISFTAQVGAFFGQQNFNEERWNWFRESDFERSSGDDTFVVAVAGLTTPGINFKTNETVNINAFGSRDFVGFTGVPAGLYYAVRVPASAITPAGPNFFVHSAQYDTAVLDASVAPVFAEATLTTGTISGITATLDLADPLARKTGFFAQDNDFAPFHVRFAKSVGQEMRERLAVPGTDVFLVLRVPTTTPFPGVSGLPPLIGLDGGVAPPAVNDAAIFGLSYTSVDGVTFTQNATYNFRFSLVLSMPPTP